MPSDHLDPDDIPDGTTAVGLVGWIAEDLVRALVLRVAGFVAAATVLAGAVSDQAEPGLRVAQAAGGTAGVVVLVVAVLARWRRRRQWGAAAVTLVACAGLLALLRTPLG